MDIVINIVIPFFALLVGWFLNELSNLFRSRGENKKVRKRLIFVLLELHHQVASLSSIKHVVSYQKKLKSLLPTEITQDEEYKSHFAAGIEFGEEINQESSIEVIEDLKPTYDEVVRALAAIDPVQAYRLNGKTSVFERFEYLKDFFDAIKEQFSENSADIHFFEKTLTKRIKVEIGREILVELEKEMLETSRKVGIIFNQQFKKELIRMKNFDGEETNKQAEKMAIIVVDSMKRSARRSEIHKQKGQMK